jgi:hypothetical protein
VDKRLLEEIGQEERGAGDRHFSPINWESLASLEFPAEKWERWQAN